MDNKSYGQLLIMQYTTDANRQYSDEKRMKLTENLTIIIASMMDQIKISKYSPYKKDSPKYQDPTSVVTAKKKVPTLEGGLVVCVLSKMISYHQNYITPHKYRTQKRHSSGP